VFNNSILVFNMTKAW